MAAIKPFKALRFTEKAGCIDQLLCPPYDIISEEERLQYIATNEHNIIRLELPKGEEPYAEAGRLLNEWLDDGILKTDDKDSLYIYEEEFLANGQWYKVKGFACRVKLEPFEKGVVLPHEFTLSKAKEDRFNLMKATDCNFSQVYSLYMDEDKSVWSKIDNLSSGEPVHKITDEVGVTHRMWTVTDEAEIAEICKLFEDKKLYIADGHHRYETALNYNEYLKSQGLATDDSGYIMMMLVNIENSGLVVFPTHRIVKGLSDFHHHDILKKCRKYFDVYEKYDVANMSNELNYFYNQNKTAFAFCYGRNDKYYILVLKDKAIMEERIKDTSKAFRELDVAVLHSLILEDIFGLDKENLANQTNLKYTRHISEAMGDVAKGEGNCAFILNPTRVSEISDVASAGEKMPQKSTYFYPKLITGLIMNKFR